MDSNRMENAGGRAVDGMEENLKVRFPEVDCPFCMLYVTEIGLKNGAFRDALYFSIHSNLESHKPENILNQRKKRNVRSGQPVVADYEVIPVS
jgi:hypothetical protein